MSRKRHATLRTATASDLAAIWRMWKTVMEQDVYYPYDRTYTRQQIEAGWVNLENLIGVAEVEGQIAGAYIVKPNQPGHGSHVANAAYMVDTPFRSMGIGRQLCMHSLAAAKAAGYRAMQFNLVVSTNIGAIKVWESLGFERIGVVPEGFYHVGMGFVDAYIYYRFL
ncbi:MAG: GNAT family N-acetyltransferase [Lewinellaceae bacterium]|nr:GNAT family N-acetyltransferase [Lewinellaceae bacterium]